ncbi:MAG: hypothetical protein E6K43_00915 [Gammaproteobacteria bacterium]|nr:MAG: hypothetical protein E6K43_00915 [Gammaproteobacteria bacterium]
MGYNRRRGPAGGCDLERESLRAPIRSRDDPTNPARIRIAQRAADGRSLLGSLAVTPVAAVRTRSGQGILRIRNGGENQVRRPEYHALGLCLPAGAALSPARQPRLTMRHWSNGGIRLPNHGQDFATLTIHLNSGLFGISRADQYPIDPTFKLGRSLLATNSDSEREPVP